MERIVAQIVEIVKSKYANELQERDNLKKIEKVFKKVSDEITAKSLKKYLEDYDQELKLDNSRNKNYVVQRTVSKNITSILGTFRLNRTKYYDKENDCYFCLLDRKLNIPEYEQYEERRVKKKVKVLYINLNEDHVAIQKSLNRKLQCKIGYVYENVIKVCKNRYKLTNKHTICGTYLKSSGNKAFYEKINDYIECNYDTKYLEKVIIYGDGAKWITSSTEYIPKSEFRLDKFHLMKSILEATRTVSNNRKRLKSNILRCFYENNKEMLIDLIDDVIEESNKPDKMIQTRDYLINNWEARQRTILSTDGSGCSAEGNVSHILSARLSQKGMGWCEHNADAIGKLRGIQANDGEEAFARIAETYYYQRTHYCEDSEVVKYIHRTNEYYDINKSYINRLQTTIPDYYMNKKIIENKDINY